MQLSHHISNEINISQDSASITFLIIAACYFERTEAYSVMCLQATETDGELFTFVRWRHVLSVPTLHLM